jgi:peptidoglycan/LPS O-acetylase OafA/YrhL
MENPEPSPGVKVAFAFWQGHLQCFFMGLLFFLSGTLAIRSLERRGPSAFAGERMMRLGPAALLYMLILHPLIVLVLLGSRGSASLGERYLSYLSSGRVLGGSGPLWFALALLGFCLGLAAWRAVTPPARCYLTRRIKPAPSAALLFGFGASLAVASFLVRTWQPIGRSVLNFQLCFFPQYIAVFTAGLLAGRGGWLEPLLDSRRARVAGWMGLIGGPLLLATVVALGGIPQGGGPSAYDGGWTWQSLGLASWEQFTGVALGLGLMAWFRSRFNTPHPVMSWLSDHSFAVYVIHAPVLVAATILLRGFEAPALVKILLLTLVGLAVSFAIAAPLRRVPLLREIL